MNNRLQLSHNERTLWFQNIFSVEKERCGMVIFQELCDLYHTKRVSKEEAVEILQDFIDFIKEAK